jgi:hypothetical protein
MFPSFDVISSPIKGNSLTIVSENLELIPSLELDDLVEKPLKVDVFLVVIGEVNNEYSSIYIKFNKDNIILYLYT